MREADSASKLSSEDARWIVNRLLTRAAWNMLSPAQHMRLAEAKSALRLRLSGVPRCVRDNLETAMGGHLGSKELNRLAYDHARFMGNMHLTSVLPEVRGFFTSNMWSIKGLTNLDKALACGKGALIATPHIGFARIIGPVLTAKGYDARRLVAKGIVHVEREERLNSWISQSKWGVKYLKPLLSLDSKSRDIPAQLDIRPIISHLSQNKPVVLAADGLRASEFSFVTLFGKPFPLATGFMKIAMATGAAIIPAMALKTRSCKIEIEIQEPIEVDIDSDVRSNLERYSIVLEHQIMQAVEQWYRWSVQSVFEQAQEWIKSGAPDRYNNSFRKAPAALRGK